MTASTVRTPLRRAARLLGALGVACAVSLGGLAVQPEEASAHATCQNTVHHHFVNHVFHNADIWKVYAYQRYGRGYLWFWMNATHNHSSVPGIYCARRPA